MATPLSNTPVERVRRVDVLAYLIVLAGVVHGDFVVAALADGVSLYVVATSVLLFLTFGAAAFIVRNPESVHKGSDPAPLYLWALAAVSTLAITALAASKFLSFG